MNTRTIYSKKLLLLWVLLLSAQLVKAQQITWGGLIDFEIRKGGENSRPMLNQTPNPNWSFFTPNIRLFMSAELNEKWWIDATLQSDYYGQTTLHSLFFSLLNINYQPFETNNFTIQAGRIVTPFGYNHRQVLSSDNPFTNYSMESAWNLRVDKKIGYFPSGSIDYTTNPGMAPVYQRRYTQGIAVTGTLGDGNLLDYTLAATLSPASGFSEYGSGNPSFIGRVVVQPVIWAKIGTSFSYGNYMMRDNSKNPDITDNQLKKPKQLAYAFDATLSYGYAELTGQYLFNRWTALIYGQFNLTNGNGLVDNPMLPENLDLHHWVIQSKVRLPFLVGAYVAARYELMTFSDIYSSPLDSTTPLKTWIPNTNRYDIALGYKITKTILAKINWQDGTNEGTDRDDYVFTAQLSVGF
jgi:hypothetical protein